MQYSQEHLKTMVYAEFGGQTECIMGNWKIENSSLAIKIVNVSCLSEGWPYWAEWRTDGMTERNGGIHGISYNTKYKEYSKRRNLHNIKKTRNINSKTQNKKKIV